MLFFLRLCKVDKCAAVLRLACKKHKLIPLRMYSEITMCADECLLCVRVCALLAAGASPAVIRSLGTTTGLLMLILDHSTV